MCVCVDKLHASKTFSLFLRLNFSLSSLSIMSDDHFLFLLHVADDLGYILSPSKTDYSKYNFFWPTANSQFKC